MEEEMQSCPFCGSDEISHGYQAPPLIGIAQCHACDAVVTAESEFDAIIAWNRIAQETQMTHHTQITLIFWATSLIGVASILWSVYQ